MVGSIPLGNAFTIYEARKLWILLHPFITPNLNPVFMHWTKRRYEQFSPKIYFKATQVNETFSPWNEEMGRMTPIWEIYWNALTADAEWLMSSQGFSLERNKLIFVQSKKHFTAQNVQLPASARPWKGEKKLLLIISNFYFFLHSSSISNVTQLTEKLSHIFSWDNFVCFTVYLFVVCFYQSWFL